MFALTGCDHFPKHQYFLGQVNPSLSKELCNELSVLASEHSLLKRENKRESTLCYFSETAQNNIVLGARLIEEQVVVDVQGFNHRKEIASLREATEKMIALKFPSAKVSDNE